MFFLPWACLGVPIMGVHTHMPVYICIDQSSSVSQLVFQGGKEERREKDKQNYNMTPASAEAEAGLFFFFPVCFYIMPDIYTEYGQS